MFKKLIITGAAAGLLLVSATGAFASSITNHASGISNLVVTVANTGVNQVNGSSSRHHTSSGLILTGDAGASSLAGNVVNTTVSGGRHAPSVTNNANGVTNTVFTVANTGANQVNGGGSIGTGNAGAQAGSFNVVNTTVSGL